MIYLEKKKSYLFWLLITGLILALFLVIALGIPWYEISKHAEDTMSDIEFLNGPTIDYIFISIIIYFIVGWFITYTILFWLLWPVFHKEKDIPRIDERTKIIIYRAGFYAFLTGIGIIISLYIFLYILYFLELPIFSFDEYIGTIFQMMIFSFVIFLFIFYKKGDIK